LYVPYTVAAAKKIIIKAHIFFFIVMALVLNYIIFTVIIGKINIKKGVIVILGVSRQYLREI
jgi:hypothetical protein